MPYALSVYLVRVGFSCACICMSGCIFGIHVRKNKDSYSLARSKLESRYDATNCHCEYCFIGIGSLIRIIRVINFWLDIGMCWIHITVKSFEYFESITKVEVAFGNGMLAMTGFQIELHRVEMRDNLIVEMG